MVLHSAKTREVNLSIKRFEGGKGSKEAIILDDSEIAKPGGWCNIIGRRYSLKHLVLADDTKEEYIIQIPAKVLSGLNTEEKYRGVVETVSSADFPGDDPRKQKVCTMYEHLVELRDKKGELIYKDTPEVLMDCLDIIEKTFSEEEKGLVKTLDDRAIKENLDLGIRTRGILRLWNNNCRSDYFRKRGIEDVMDMSDLVLREYRDYINKLTV